MTVRKQLGYAMPFALATMLAGPATAGIIFNDVAAIRDQNPTGTAFAPQLTAEYRKLAIFEADEMYDWIDAEKHANKGMMAANGQIPMPSDPADFNIKYADKLAELQAARADGRHLRVRAAGRPRRKKKTSSRVVLRVLVSHLKIGEWVSPPGGTAPSM